MKSAANYNTAHKPLLGRGLGRPGLIVYGIPNCDATKKAITWLNKNKIAFSFHDYKLEGISKQKLEEWFVKENWENIFNKRSTTWRELPVAVQNKVTDRSSAIKVMIENNSIIKRPVIEFGSKLITGFNEEQYIKQIKKS